MEIILYSTGCPKCQVLEKKLKAKNLKFEICNDINIMKEKGFTQMPILEINKKELAFKEAVDWIKEVEEVAN